MTAPKRCKDCRHYRRAMLGPASCDVIPDTSCEWARTRWDLCGTEARWFEPKEGK